MGSSGFVSKGGNQVLSQRGVTNCCNGRSRGGGNVTPLKMALVTLTTWTASPFPLFLLTFAFMSSDRSSLRHDALLLYNRIQHPLAVALQIYNKTITKQTNECKKAKPKATIFIYVGAYPPLLTMTSWFKLKKSLGSKFFCWVAVLVVAD